MLKKSKKKVNFFASLFIITGILSAGLIDLTLEKKIYEVDENICKSDNQVSYSYIITKIEVQDLIYFLKKLDFHLESAFSIIEYSNKIIYKSYTFFIPQKLSQNFHARDPPEIQREI